MIENGAMKLIAHRGGAGLRVENTLAAFENALELGADGAELDVHLTRDGEVVVHHDDTLNGRAAAGAMALGGRARAAPNL